VPASTSATSTTATTDGSARSRPGGPEHRLDRVAGDLREGQQVRVIETPFRRVYNRLSVVTDADRLEGRTLRRPAAGPDSKEVLPAGAKLDADATARLRSAGVPSVDIVPWASPEVHYLSADEEDLYSVAQANAALHEDGTFQEVRVPSRDRGEFAVTEATTSSTWTSRRSRSCPSRRP